MSEQFDWQDAENKEAEPEINDDLVKRELEIDNEILEQKLCLSEGISFKSKDTDAYHQNQFLRSILEFHALDDGPHRDLITIFPEGFDLPPVESLNKTQLKGKLRVITEIMGEHRISLDLVSSLPDEQVYEYISEEVIHQNIPLEILEGFTLHLDGCDGYCPGCFQRNNCEVRKDVWQEDPRPERKIDGCSSALE